MTDSVIEAIKLFLTYSDTDLDWFPLKGLSEVFEVWIFFFFHNEQMSTLQT